MSLTCSYTLSLPAVANLWLEETTYPSAQIACMSQQHPDSLQRPFPIVLQVPLTEGQWADPASLDCNSRVTQWTDPLMAQVCLSICQATKVGD